ncbi:Alpha-amylase 1 [Daphnia magna]|uniref:Alpha-amylase n=1 Tax=Daphnia magna TaxID=35525 RepID=A0A0P5FPS5_9CRUS|nr:Alpha-amylase 1 [Daphnia magna]
MKAIWFFAVSCLIVGSVVGQYDPNCDGKTVIVHLFEWKWSDIAAECERFLGPAGYCGFQVSPPTEHVILPDNNPPQPWWQRYQPVSYILHSRSGNPDEFAEMVRRCNAVGVRTYVDAVINHMSGLGRLGVSYAGSPYDGDALDFPGVPYSAEHFTPKDMCPSYDGNVNNYGDPNNVRNCYLVGLTDLYGALDYVRESVAGYLNSLVAIGVAGIRIDAAKHMWPLDIAAITSRVNTLPTEHGFPPNSKFFVYSEVIDRNDGAVRVDEYYDVGLVTEFRYCMKLAWGINDYGQLGGLIDYGWGMARDDRAFVFVDNHDNQRGHGGAGDVITHKTPREYKQAVSYMLAHPYGFTQVMSSYYFDNSDVGPPHNEDYSAADVIIKPDGSCDGGWVCEHRWNPIAKMVRFRNAVAGTAMENYWNNGGAVSFSRGNKGFFAMAKGGSMTETLVTGLPAGTYCNIIDDCATSITVGSDGKALVQINNYEEPIFAACVGCETGPVPTATAGTARPTTPTTPKTTVYVPTVPCVGPGCSITTTTTARPPNGNRTVIFIQKQTNPGQDMFIRGGIDHTVRPGCVEDASTSPCAIPIQIASLGTTAHYAKYDAWAVGDTRLDWYGTQVGQGSYTGQPASGTPLAWTSNKPSEAGYQELNAWGDHYWMVEMDMDCSQTEQGWFEVKAFLTNSGSGWETDVVQSACTGNGAGTPPYISPSNHMGRCGFINVFTFSAKVCQIIAFD